MEIREKRLVINVKREILIRSLTFWVLSSVRRGERHGDFQIVLEGLGRVLMFQMSWSGENDVPRNDMSIDNFLVNQIGAWWRLLRETKISALVLTPLH